MAKQDLIAHVLPSDGWYCIMGLKKDAMPEQRFVQTLEDVEKAADDMVAADKDVYFGCAKFNSAKNRGKDNAAFFKAFWLDIDCGAGKPYATQGDGLSALKDFCSRYKLPKPTIVNSGRGIHVYWTLTETIDIDKWQPVADKLKHLCQTQGLFIDPSVTSDAARILRVPETFNHKDPTNPLPVTVLYFGTHTDYEVFKDALGAVVADLPKPTEDFIPPHSSALTLSLLGNTISKFKTILKKTAEGVGCNQIGYAAANQDTVDEPLWRAVLSVANVCEDREKAIHAISSQHPEYDAEETEHKARLTKGPYTCQVFAKFNPDGCEGCPNKGKIKSPIVLGQDIARDEGEEPEQANEQATPTQTAPTPSVSFPWPYFRGKNGGIYVEVVEGEKPELVYEHDLILVKRMVDPNIGECAWLRRTLPKDGVKEFSVPMAALLSKEEMRKLLPANGVIGSSKQMERIMSYLIAVAKELQVNKEAEKMRTQFGWVDDDTKIILGDKEISKDSVAYSPPSTVTKAVAETMRSAGSIERWKEIFNTYALPGFEAQAFATLTGFGAPLMRFLNIHGCVINLINNESGTGKSTVLHMMNSIVGHPEELLLQWKDTYHSIIHRFGVMNNFAVGIDEVTKMDGDLLSDLLYSVTQGRGKERMKQSSNEVRVNHTKWALPVVTTSNSSIKDKLASMKATYDGESMRLMEFRISLTENIPKDKAAEIFGDLFENYGHAGLIFCQYVLTHKDECIALVKKVQAKLDKDIGFRARERFWSTQAACNIAGGMIAQSLGLHDYPMKTIYQWVVEELTDMRKESSFSAISSSAVLGEFINIHVMNTLVVNGMVDNRTSLHGLPILEPRGPLLCRYEPDTRMMFLAAKQFRAFCSKQQVTYDELIRQLEKDGVLQGIVRKRMTKGSKIVGAPVNALMLDCSKGDFVSLEDYVAKKEEPAVESTPQA